MSVMCAFLFFLFFSGTVLSDSEENRDHLREMIRINDVKPLESEPFEITKKYLLGQALFFDPLLSTNNDISCATCHLISKGSSDGLERSLSASSSGLSSGEKFDENHLLNHRNSLSLYNRDHNTVKNLFWDGRVEVLDPSARKFKTPLENLLPQSIENILAAQALFPLVNNREMFSRRCLEGVSCRLSLDTPRAIKEEHDRIMKKILGRSSEAGKLTKSQGGYRKLFLLAYPNLNLNQLDIGHLGNAIAHFEEVAFATRDSSWDRFVSGVDEELSGDVVEGANIFYGRGQCVSCHSGDVFSDYEFHALGILSYKEVAPVKIVDMGRYSVTKEVRDQFLFRTPSLRNITLTSPYFHDGSESKLKSAIQKHAPFCSGPEELKSFCMSINFEDSLSAIGSLSDRDLDNLMKFLGSLEDNLESYWDHIVPRTLPSGLPVN